MPSFVLTPSQRARIAHLVIESGKSQKLEIKGLDDMRAFNRLKLGLRLGRPLDMLVKGKTIGGDYLIKDPPAVFDLDPAAVKFLLDRVLVLVSDGVALYSLGPLVDAIDAYTAGKPLPAEGPTVDPDAEPWEPADPDPIQLAIDTCREIAASDLSTEHPAIAGAHRVVVALDRREAQILAAAKARAAVSSVSGTG